MKERSRVNIINLVRVEGYDTCIMPADWYKKHADETRYKQIQ